MSGALIRGTMINDHKGGGENPEKKHGPFYRKINIGEILYGRGFPE